MRVDEDKTVEADGVMIALYYWYVEIPKDALEPHRDFHKSLCKDLCLFGRIRISSEGLNGVLSGEKCNLERYERRLREEISSVCFKSVKQSADQLYGEFLDVKYCHLRDDLSVEKQMFTSLSVKVTKEVVSLNEPAATEKQNRRRRKGQNKKKHLQQQNEATLKRSNDKPIDAESKSMTSGQHVDSSFISLAEKKLMQPQKNICLDNYEPAKHLTPQQWNTQILHDSETDCNAVLIDARNVYESNIGHFTVKGIPTLLTNTRKYSTIPSVLKASIPDLSGKNVYMYCTGGVRCERASVYLQALADSTEWPEGVEKPKSIFQLQGGIQKYLENFGKKVGEEDKIQNKTSESSSDSDFSPQKEEGPCLFKGKNFVFDQRRYDPVVGGDGKPVGKCVVCSCPHDDYDNGHAPCENKEARCHRCRVLVLVCNNCRSKVRICGETVDDSVDEAKRKPDLSCGGVFPNECINEGNEVNHCELRNY